LHICNPNNNHLLLIIFNFFTFHDFELRTIHISNPKGKYKSYDFYHGANVKLMRPISDGKAYWNGPRSGNGTMARWSVKN